MKARYASVTGVGGGFGNQLTSASARCITNISLLLLLLLLPGLGIAEASLPWPVCSAAVLLLCKAVALSREGRYALLGQSTITTLAPSADASITCNITSRSSQVIQSTSYCFHLWEGCLIGQPKACASMDARTLTWRNSFSRTRAVMLLGFWVQQGRAGQHPLPWVKETGQHTSAGCTVLPFGSSTAWAGLEPPKHGPLGHAQGRCLLGVEAAGRVGQVADVAAGRPLTSQWRHLQQIASLCM